MFGGLWFVCVPVRLAKLCPRGTLTVCCSAAKTQETQQIDPAIDTMVQRRFQKLFLTLIFILAIAYQNEVQSLRSKSVIFNGFRSSRNCQAEIDADISTVVEPGETITIIRDKDEHYMRLALRHAQHSFREKEVPIGAVIVDKDGTILATSRNQVETENDVTAHAELSCIRKATQIKKNWRLTGCTLYSTLEPCPMCMGAIQASRISKVVYGAPDIRVGACGSWIDLVGSKHPFHDVEVVGGLLRDESSIMLKRFFQMRRRENASSSAVVKGSSGGDISGDIADNDSAILSLNIGDDVTNTYGANNRANVDDDRGNSLINASDCDSESSSHIDRGYNSD